MDLNKAQTFLEHARAQSATMGRVLAVAGKNWESSADLDRREAEMLRDAARRRARAEGRGRPIPSQMG